jgi:predicted SprT family Zn-dependent metalloprotease
VWTSEARALATRLMREHGLPDWRLVFDNARTRAGVCRAGRREIGLSRVLTELHTDAEVRDTILHEIAHALVGPDHGHDAVWRAKAREIGCSGERCVPAGAAKPDAPWVGTCPAGHEVRRYRRPQRVHACGHCSTTFDPRALISWQHHGRTVPMHPRYVAELARITTLLTGSPGGGARVPTAARGGQSPSAGPAPLTAAAKGRLPVGSRVRLGGTGRYAGLTGEVVKRGRTRYHVQTEAGLLTVPFALVRGA